MRQTIGDFLLRRLEDVRVEYLFGVPGDYNLEFMQQIEDHPTLQWIGNANELNAAYAADGYARMRGLGAVVVTDGVGALSAVNGIAGAFSEHVPVICICGSLPTRSLQHRDLMHHTLADGRDIGSFRRIFSEITAGDSTLTTQNAAAEIDRLIQTAWHTKRPVYIELPSDLALLEIETPDEPLVLAFAKSDHERLVACADAITARLAGARAPALLLDVDADRFAIHGLVDRMSELGNIPVAVMNTCIGSFDHTSNRFAGVYQGAAGSEYARTVVENSDALITIGHRRVDSTSGFFSDTLPDTRLQLEAYSADIDGISYQGIVLPELLDVIVDRLATTERRADSSRPDIQPNSADGRSALRDPAPAGRAELTQTEYWQEVQQFLREDDVLIMENGSSNAGGGALALPAGCTVINQAVWGSIGYTLAATVGSMFAAPERRHLLLIGDGSFQLTVQELSTLLHHDLDPVILLINNGGYTIERTIMGRDAAYNNVPNWRYSELPRVFGPDRLANTAVVRTQTELRSALASNHTGLTLIEARLAPEDAPVGLIQAGHAAAELDYGPRGPHHRPGAVIPLPAVPSRSAPTPATRH